ncbi:ABC transporter substrate-binding protein [Rhizobium ruizarguesonis]|uniref:ABC transporter substrate-binding protein n=1 Tax=Rhizobium ruizarguesonis TaxID=2081791 RepID=UPI00102F94F2|nr:ABC transporter substrate-binding protein [Rhizobium ruizarguesonis]TAT96073.1 ABC transporter substrate-binding protein [Rhizobium ruizarguesonis]
MTEFHDQNDVAENVYADLWLDRRRFLMGTAIVGGGALISQMTTGRALAAGQRGGTLRYGFGDSSASEHLDPARAQNGASIEMMQIIYEPLVRRGKNWTFHPWLAESYELAKDSNTWTFKIRKGVKFHDGSAMTAKDVAYTLGRLVDEKVGAGLRSRLKATFAKENLEVVDDYTLKINMLRRDTLLEQPLSRYNAGIIKAGSVPLIDPSTAMGTGAFKAVSLEPGQSWAVDRFEQYWQPDVPALDAIQCISIPDQSAKVQSVVSGAVDLIDPVDAVILKQLAENPAVQVQPLQNAMRWSIFLNQKFKPFDDVRVRRAIKLAVDRKMILDKVFQGYGVVSPDVPVPPGDPTFPDDVGTGAQDIEGAKKLLAEAGFPDGIEFTLYTSPILFGMVDLAVAFAESVKEAGIKVTVNQWPAATYWDQVWIKYPTYIDYAFRRNAHDALDIAYAKGTAYAAGTNFDEDGKLREFIDKALIEPDAAKQTEMYKSALKRVAMDSGVIIPCFLDQNYIMTKKVKGDLFQWESPIAYSSLSKEA